jgi:hypothetical protein
MVKKAPKNAIVDCEGELFVRVDLIMHPLIPYIDAIQLVRFQNQKQAYMSFDDAIAWCDKEANCHSKEKYLDIVAQLNRIRKETEALKGSK